MKTEANKKGEKIVFKRLPPGPKDGKMVRSKETTVECFCPQEFISNTF